MTDQPAPDPAVEVTARRGTVSGGLWNAAATVLPMGSTLALSIVISRELGAAVLGEQSVIAYVASLLVSVFIFSFTTASIQLLATAVGARDDDRAPFVDLDLQRRRRLGAGRRAGHPVTRRPRNRPRRRHRHRPRPRPAGPVR